MTDKLKKIVEEEMVKLPKEIREAIGVVDWGKITEEVGNRHLLNEGETNDLQVETSLVLFGLTYEESYPMNIENEVGTTKEEAREIAEEIGEKVFEPIYNKLTEIIKINLKTQNANWEQNLKFITSGGNYLNFLKGNSIINSDNNITPLENGKKLSDFKNKFTI